MTLQNGPGRRKVESVDIPPTVVAIREEPRQEIDRYALVVPWEDAAAADPLFGTALLVTTEAPNVAARLALTSVMPALAFAVLAEVLAIGSLAVCLLPAVYVLYPSFIERLSEDTEFALHSAAFGAFAVLVVALVMVAFHLLWGVGMELGIRSKGIPSDVRRASRFVCYTCGWDLITSPYGLIAALRRVGRSGMVKALGAAVTAPRRATRAYLELARGLRPAEQRRAFAVAAILTGGAVLAVGVSVFTAVLFAWLGTI